MSALNLLLRLGNKPAWSPYHIGRSVLKAWWNADDHASSLLMTDDGAGLISSWSDRMSQLAVTGATSARPTWGATAFNGTKPGLTFDGAANVLVTTTLTTLPTGAVPGSIAFSADPGATTGANKLSLISYGGNASASRREVDRTIVGGDSIFLTANDATMNTTGPSGWLAPALGVAQFSATTVGGYFNGTALTTSGAGVMATATSRLRMGASANGASPTVSGSWIVRQLFILSSILDTATRQKLEGWIAWDGGIQSALPSDHPYAAAPP